MSCLLQAHAQPHVKPAFDRAAHPERMPPKKPAVVDRNKKSPQSIKEDFKRAADPPPPSGGGGGKAGGGDKGGGGGGAAPPAGPKPTPPRLPK